ncbi:MULTISPECIES: 2OG-Fe(II) oxygenase [Flavobacterium]|uniref:2OG-Fe(II) oxygenase n=1 Tax=Flavobacterium jumunjinense TaxID=998845 RepID=A0ABV5GMR1_9FLAO|nr:MULTISPECIES: 2OG-Fe(II) oxygenase [Flavobacterium]
MKKEPSNTIINILPDPNFTCYVITSLFSKDECEQLLNPKIKESFEKAIVNYPTYYRNNERYVIDDNELSEKLFKKVKPYLPKTIEVNTGILSENGKWHLHKLNNRIRFCKYSLNQYFNRHLDGIYHQDEKTQSKLTFMIYLNNATEFEGGKTLFYRSKDSTEIWGSYIPKLGDLIVFDHNVWHEGETLLKGEKFVLRSDILYTRNFFKIEKPPFYGHLGYIWSLLKFDENAVLSGGRDKEIKVWSVDGKLKQVLKGHGNSILSIEKINSDTFITGSRDQSIIVWKNYTILREIKIHNAVVLSLCKLDDTTFVSSGGDNTIKIVTLEGTVLKVFNEHKSWVWKLIRISDEIVISASEDKTIKLWNLQLNQSVITFHENHPVISLEFNKETSCLLSGNLNGDITIRKLNNYFEIEEELIFNAHCGIIRTIKWLNNGQFVTGGEDNKVKIWNREGELISEFQHQNFVQAIELLDNRTLLTGSFDGTIKRWSLK